MILPANGSPSFASQMYTLPFMHDTISSSASRRQSSATTSEGWFSDSFSPLPSKSHVRTVWSHDPDASCVPRPLNRRQEIGPSWPVSVSKSLPVRSDQM